MKVNFFYCFQGFALPIGLDGHLLGCSRKPFSLIPLGNFKFFESQVHISDGIVEHADMLKPLAGVRRPYVRESSYFAVFDKPSLFGRENHVTALHDLRRAVGAFRLKMRENLFSSLADPGATVESHLRSFVEYVFYDHFTFWVYNPKTETFTFVAGSLVPEKNFIKRSEESSLNEVLEITYKNEFRSPAYSKYIDLNALEIQSMTRIKLDLKQGEIIGVVSLYSAHLDLKIQESSVRNIRQILSLKYVDEMLRIDDSTAEVTQFIADFHDLDDRVGFIEGLVGKLSRHLQFQACSFFEHQKDKGVLALIACAEKVRSYSVRSPNVIYPLEIKTLTTSTFNKEENLKVVYDLSDHPYNTHFFDEDTEAPGQNWIGLTVFAGPVKFGLIRLRNRFKVSSNDDIEIVAPTPADYSNLKLIGSLVSNFFSASMRLEEINEERRRLNNFVKVFRHEVRVPVGHLVWMPNEAERYVESIPGNLEAKEKLKNIFEDIKVVADRLVFLTRIYRASELFDDGKIEKVSLLRDLIFPIKNLTARYLKETHGIDLIIDHQAFRGVQVHSNKVFLNTVLNALLDNAAKYIGEESDRVIRLFAEHDAKNPRGPVFKIYVESDSLEIHDDETSKIFDNWVRGREAKMVKSDGTGVGLWLARSMMLAVGGDLVLIHRCRPVIFAMLLPAESRS